MIRKKIEKEGNKAKNRKLAILVLIFLIILIGILIGKSMARYQTVITGNIVSQIAKPVLELRREESMIITANNPNESFEFEIRNYKEDIQEQLINQVDMEYYIEVITNKNEAVNIKLYREDKPINLINNKTEKFDLAKTKKEIHKYRLEINYDKTKGELNKDINENVEIKVHSIQKS